MFGLLFFVVCTVFYLVLALEAAGAVTFYFFAFSQQSVACIVFLYIVCRDSCSALDRNPHRYRATAV